MKKTTLCSLPILLALCAARAVEPPVFTVKPARLTSTAPLPDALPQQVKNIVLGGPFAFHVEDTTKTRYEAVFLINGPGLIAVHPETLKLDSVTTPDGKDISRDYRGLSTVTPGRESLVSDDGRHGVFSASVTSDEPAPSASPVFKGSIQLKTSAKAETATHTVQLAQPGPGPVKLGPFEVSVTAQRQTLRVKLAGPSELIAGLEVAVDGKKVSTTNIQFSSSSINGNASFSIAATPGTEFKTRGGPVGAMFNNAQNFGDFVDAFSMDAPRDNARTYSFTLPKDAAEATLSLTHWSDPSDQTLSFDVTMF